MASARASNRGAPAIVTYRGEALARCVHSLSAVANGCQASRAAATMGPRVGERPWGGSLEKGRERGGASPLVVLPVSFVRAGIGSVGLFPLAERAGCRAGILLRRSPAGAHPRPLVG